MSEVTYRRIATWISRRLFFVSLILVFGGCAAGDLRDTYGTVLDKPVSTSVTLPPFQTHEKCMKLLTGQKLEYSFKATKSVDFNVHFHSKEKQKIFYPLTRKQVLEDAGVFVPENPQVYCMNWDNLAFENNSLDFEYTVRSK